MSPRFSGQENHAQVSTSPSDSCSWRLGPSPVQPARNRLFTSRAPAPSRQVRWKYRQNPMVKCLVFGHRGAFPIGNRQSPIPLAPPASYTCLRLFTPIYTYLRLFTPIPREIFSHQPATLPPGLLAPWRGEFRSDREKTARRSTLADSDDIGHLF